MDNEKKVLQVKTIVNPQVTNSISFKYEFGPKKEFHLKITLQKIADVNQVLAELKNCFKAKFDFSVQFNWKNVPIAIRENEIYRAEIMKIFHGKTKKKPNDISQEEYAKYGISLKKHIDTYGCAPQLTERATDKHVQKIYNYIKTALGLPQLTIEQALLIADRAM